MKLTIQRGESIENAIQYLQDFLENKKQEFPILHENMSIYFELKGFGERFCPDNKKNYILKENGPVDVDTLRQKTAKEATLDGWKRYLRHQCKNLGLIKSKIADEVRYLSVAEKMGRKPETIARHEHQLEAHQSDLLEAQSRNRLLQTLNDCVQSGNFKWFFAKDVLKQQPYNYTFRAGMFFENSDGFTGYFIGYRSEYGNWGSLRSGLPDEK